MEDKPLSHEESMRLIGTMLNKAKNSYHDTGIVSILWGTVITVCSLVTFAQIKGYFKLPFDIWLLTLVAVVPTIYLSIKEKKINKAKFYDEKLLDYVWTCFGIGIGVLSFIQGSIFHAFSKMVNEYIQLSGKDTLPFRYSEFSSAFFLLWYGFPTIVTGGAKGLKPMLFGGIFCWVAAIVSLFTSADVDMLLTAAAALLSWFIPGIILWNKFKHRKLQENV